MMPGRFSCFYVMALSVCDLVGFDVQCEVALGVEIRGALKHRFQKVKVSLQALPSVDSSKL